MWTIAAHFRECIGAPPSELLNGATDRGITRIGIITPAHAYPHKAYATFAGTMVAGYYFVIFRYYLIVLQPEFIGHGSSLFEDQRFGSVYEYLPGGGLKLVLLLLLHIMP